MKRLYIVTLIFSFYAEYIMQSDRLDEAQAGIKTAGRNINNLRYADDTNLMAESEEELKSLFMRLKEEGKKIALTRWTFVGKVMSLLFNMLSRFVIAFFPRSQASFNFMAAVTVHGDFGV